MKPGSNLEKSDKLIVGVTLLCTLLLFSWLVYDMAFTNPGSNGQAEVGQIYQMQNKVKRKFKGSLIWYPAAKDEVVFENDWIFTGSNSIAKIKLRTGGEIIVEPDSLIVLTRKNGVLQLDLQHGRLMANVNKNDIKINVVRNGAVEAVDTEAGYVAVSQKEANDDVNIDVIKTDKNNDGVEDVSLSKLADRKYYEPKEGYSDLQTNGLSYQKYAVKNESLFSGQKTDVPFNWEDPNKEWTNYEIEIATDENFSNVLAKESTNKPGFVLNTDNPGPYHWRVRGVDANGNASQWSENLISDLQLEFRKKGPGVQLAESNIEYVLDNKEVKSMAPNRTHSFKGSKKAIQLKWNPDLNATNYKVQISDKKDFSNILEEKIVDTNSLTLENVKLGETYFKVVPENAEGISVADDAKGEIHTYLPSPDDDSLKTVDQVEYQTLTWDNVPHAHMYEVTYTKSKEATEPIVAYVEKNELKVPSETGYLQWKVRAVDPVNKKKLSNYSKTVDWYDAAKRLASIHGTGQAGISYPVITNPTPRKTFISVNQSPLFIVMSWTYEKEVDKYTVEISTKPDMSQLVYSQNVAGKKRTVVKQKFNPGIYYMRVRALTQTVTDEIWSETEVFRVINRDL